MVTYPRRVYCTLADQPDPVRLRVLFVGRFAPLPIPHLWKTLGGFLTLDSILTFEAFRNSAVLTDDDPSSSDLLSFVGDRGHAEFRCLSPNQNPSACVPCLDFSPWLRERARQHDVEGLAEYLWRVRRANPGQGDSADFPCCRAPPGDRAQAAGPLLDRRVGRRPRGVPAVHLPPVDGTPRMAAGGSHATSSGLSP